MPVVNAIAVESAIRIGLALNCEIAEWCRFARKNYFYPDMPKNFQTSQYDEPIAFEGWTDVVVEGPDGPQTVRVDIERAHMEEDTGKSLHVGGATGRIHGADYSLVDYNRAGIPLIEIVTKPILGTREIVPLVAKAYVAQLRDLLLGLGVSDVRMEQGSLRCDVNLSLAPRDTGEDLTTAPSHGHSLGTRTETKNVNSLRSVERAVRYEVQRHAAVLTSGRPILQETRHWHEDTGVTTSGREKSDAEDYRYFPEPDLVPMAPDKEWVETAAGRAARAAARAAGPAPGGVGLLRPRDARHGRRRCARPGRADHRGRCAAGGGAQVVALRAGPPRQRVRDRHRGPGREPGRGGARPGARRRGPDQRQARAPGVRRPASPAKVRPTRSSRPAVSRSSPTTAPCRRRSTTPSPPTPTSPTRSATARSPPPAP